MQENSEHSNWLLMLFIPLMKSILWEILDVIS